MIALKRVVPILRMFDIDKARDFYFSYLGFSLDFEHRFHDGAPLFMGISRDEAQLFLSEHHGDGSPGAHITIDVSDIDGLREELTAKKYRYMNPGVEKKEWGTRELTVIDPFGNHIAFREHPTNDA